MGIDLVTRGEILLFDRSSVLLFAVIEFNNGL
jgi:hypothetical protein